MNPNINKQSLGSPPGFPPGASDDAMPVPDLDHNGSPPGASDDAMPVPDLDHNGSTPGASADAMPVPDLDHNGSPPGASADAIPTPHLDHDGPHPAMHRPKKSHGNQGNTFTDPLKNTSSTLHVGLLNARSAKQQSTSGEIHDLIADIGLHVLVITETWLRKGDLDSVACGEMTPDGFKLQHLPRANKRGGGLAIIHTSALQVSSMRSITCASFEGFSLTITSSGSTVCLVAIYRPPQNSIPEYLNDFTDLIESIITSTATELLVIGDFNIHWTAANDNGASRFRNITESLGLTQHVDFPTHSRGHVLDLIFSRFTDIGLTVTGKDHTVNSDHACVLFALTFPCPKKVTKTISIRKLRAIDTESLCRDVSVTFATLPTDDCSSACEQYNLRLQHLLNQHAPMKTVTITTKPDSPWFTFEVRSARRELRRLERQWQKSGLSVHHEMFRAQRNRLTSIRRAAKKTYYSDKFQSAQTMKDRNNLLSSVMQNKNKRDPVLPAASLGDCELAQRFSEFYIDKIKTIRCNITGSSMNVVNLPEHQSQISPLSSFRETSEDELTMLIHKSPTKSSSLDPIPTWLLKKCLPGFLPILTRLINSSLSSGCVPTSLKKAVIRPLLKKVSLDSEVLKNYRPVSNLSFLSKLLERVVATRLNEHCTDNNLDVSFQSAYTKQTTVVKLLSTVFIMTSCKLLTEKAVPFWYCWTYQQLLILLTTHSCSSICIAALVSTGLRSNGLSLTSHPATRQFASEGLCRSLSSCNSVFPKGRSSDLYSLDCTLNRSLRSSGLQMYLTIFMLMIHNSMCPSHPNHQHRGLPHCRTFTTVCF